jgi:hypothetical protein
MFADDQVTISDNEDTLQRAFHELNKILDHNFEIHIHKTKNTAFCGKWPVKSKLILYNQPTEQVSKFSYIGCQLSYQGEVDVNHELEKFNYTCGTIKRNRKTKPERKHRSDFIN